MADETEQVAPEHQVEQTVQPQPRRRRVTQAEWDATRRANKEIARETVKANAKEAQAAKRKALAKEPRNKAAADFRKAALEIEARMNAPKDEGTE